MPCNCLFKYSKVTFCINWTSWSCRCVYRQLLISSAWSVSLQWVSWPRSQSQVSIMLCLSKYSVLLSRALQQRQDTVLGQSRGVWSWAGSWSAGSWSASTEQFCKPPWRYLRTEGCKLSGELPKAAVLRIYRVIASLVLHCDSWVSHLHPH